MILVVSRDPAALALARDYEARTVLEDGSPELNTALRRASKVAQAYQAMEILVIPADLPLVKPEDIQQFLKHSGNPPEVIIAPDRRRDGTNALFINPADLIEFRYGNNSFNVHLDLAKKANARIEVVDMDTIALDLDLPEDLEYLNKLEREKQDIQK
jgi:2-phospho-L-lactate guanylyltransferase